MDSLESFGTCPVTSFAGWDKVVPYQDFISISGRSAEQSKPTSINTLQLTGKTAQTIMLRETLHLKKVLPNSLLLFPFVCVSEDVKTENGEDVVMIDVSALPQEKDFKKMYRGKEIYQDTMDAILK